MYTTYLYNVHTTHVCTIDFIYISLEYIIHMNFIGLQLRLGCPKNSKHLLSDPTRPFRIFRILDLEKFQGMKGFRLQRAFL